METKERITQEEFDQHDCHATPAGEDGCTACAAWNDQKEEDARRTKIEPEGIMWCSSGKCFYCSKSVDPYATGCPHCKKSFCD